MEYLSCPAHLQAIVTRDTASKLADQFECDPDLTTTAAAFYPPRPLHCQVATQTKHAAVYEPLLFSRDQCLNNLLNLLHYTRQIVILLYITSEPFCT
jgi:hypothetical protein